MGLVARYDPETDIVETTQSGTVTDEGLNEETRAGAELIQAHACSRYLSDYSRATLDVTDMAVFALPSVQENVALPRSTCIAVLAPPTERGREAAEFYETVSRNRGWTAKWFYDRDKAIEWLDSLAPRRSERSSSGRAKARGPRGDRRRT